MKLALFLVDMQNDFLHQEAVYPSKTHLIAACRELLDACRRRNVTVFHIWTTMHRGRDERMPHWRLQDKWICVEGTQGHQTPPSLVPMESEAVIHKTGFSAFTGAGIQGKLEEKHIDSILIAGLHTHSCLRATAIDAYQRNFQVYLARDATGSYDAGQAAATRRYLAQRCMPCVSLDEIFGDDPRGEFAHLCPRSGARLWSAEITSPESIERYCRAAHDAARDWRKEDERRRLDVLLKWLKLIEASEQELVAQMASEIGKPVRVGRQELTSARGFLTELGRHPVETLQAPGFEVKRRPQGVIAAITPYNNPVAIPVGKLAPALFYGNAVIWKPAPAATRIAARLLNLLHQAGCPRSLVGLVAGGGSCASAIMENRFVDAVTFTGSLENSYPVREVCARRHLELQAELGGNNAAIVCPDFDPSVAASKIAHGAFLFAGQKCTATRRAIILGRDHESFMEHVVAATRSLNWGEPHDPGTQVGPLVTARHKRRISAMVDSVSEKFPIHVPHAGSESMDLPTRENGYYPPTIVVCNDPDQELVQEEHFGPILIVQTADDWQHALNLCNGVRQGLVASVFTNDRRLQDSFLAQARAGMLQINRSTTEVSPHAPFGGWKASGIGPFEHHRYDLEFYTRPQTVYRAP